MDAKAKIETIATVLAISVLIDDIEKDQELVEFTHGMMTINQRIRPETIFPRTKILDWFHKNKIDIAQNIANDTDDSWKSGLLEQIDDQSLQCVVLSAMFSISVCDYQLDQEECDFINLALQLWKREMPEAQTVEMVVG